MLEADLLSDILCNHRGNFFRGCINTSTQSANWHQCRTNKGPHSTEVTCRLGFFFHDRGVRGGLRSPRIVHRRHVSVWGRLDRTRMWAEGLSPTLHWSRRLPRGQVWLPPGLDGWTLHHRWVHLPTLDWRLRTTEEVNLRADLKGQFWRVNVRIFRERQTSVAAYLLQISTFAWH